MRCAAALLRRALVPAFGLLVLVGTLSIFLLAALHESSAIDADIDARSHRRSRRRFSMTLTDRVVSVDGESGPTRRQAAMRSSSSSASGSSRGGSSREGSRGRSREGTKVLSTSSIHGSSSGQLGGMMRRANHTDDEEVVPVVSALRQQDLGSGFCVRSGIAIDGRPGEARALLTATLPLARARAFCTSDDDCAGFSVKLNSNPAPSGSSMPLVHFVRRGPRRDGKGAQRPSTAADSSATGALRVACDAKWLTFVRSAGCQSLERAGQHGNRSAAAAAISSSSPREGASPGAHWVTVVTQLSRNRWSALLALADKWPHELVAALACEDATEPPSLPLRLATRVQLPTLMVARGSGSGNSFPINKLRNLAIGELGPMRNYSCTCARQPPTQYPRSHVNLHRRSLTRGF